MTLRRTDGTRPARTVLVAAAAVALCLAGCTTQSPDGLAATGVMEDPSPAGVAAEPSASTAGLVVPLPPPDPLDAYVLDSTEVVAVLNAIGILTDECMSGFGFTPRPRLGATTAPDPRNVLDANLGYAHWTPEREEWERAADAANAAIAAEDPPSEAYLLVLDGGAGWKLGDPQPKASPKTYQGKQIPVGGCEGYANATVAGGDPYTTPLREMGGSGPLVKDLTQEAADLTAGDPRVHDLDHRWSACMAGQGFDYATPPDAASGHPTSAGPAAPGEPSAWDPYAPATPEELATARADVTCQLQLDYQTTLASIRAEHQRPLIEASQLALYQLGSAQDQLVRRAADVVAGNGASK